MIQSLGFMEDRGTLGQRTREIPWHMSEGAQDPEVAQLDAFEEGRHAAIVTTKMMFDEMGLDMEPGALSFEDEVELQVEVQRVEKQIAIESIKARRKQAIRREQGDLAEADEALTPNFCAWR